MIRTSVFAIDDFAGGLNTKTGSMQLPPNYSPNCVNVHSNLYKSLQARNGMSKLNTTAQAETKGNGLFVFPYWSAGTLIELLIAFFDDKMYKMDSLDGTYDSVTLGTAQSNDEFESTVFSTTTQNYFIFGNASLNTLQVYTGSGATTNLNTGTMDSAKHMIAWKKHMWFGFTKESSTNYPYRLRRTDLNTYGSSASDFTAGVAGFDDVITNDGDYITGFALLRGFLYVFKRYSIFRVSYLGGSPLVEIRQISSIGTNSPRSIKNITLINGDEILMFWGSDNRIYLFNGYNAPQPVSELVSEDNGYSSYSLPKVNMSCLDIINAENYERKHWYVVFFPTGTSTTNNAGYIIDYYSIPFSIWPISGWNMHSCCIAKDSVGSRNLYASSYNGRTYKLDTGNNDDGNNINAIYELPKLKVDKVPMLKRAQQAQTLLKAIGNYNVELGYRTNFLTSYKTKNINQAGGNYLLGSTFTLGTATLGGTESLMDTYDVPEVFNFIQFRYKDDSTNPRFNLYQLDLMGQPEGIARV